jgi:hypothetical protein
MLKALTHRRGVGALWLTDTVYPRGFLVRATRICFTVATKGDFPFESVQRVHVSLSAALDRRVNELPYGQSLPGDCRPIAAQDVLLNLAGRGFGKLLDEGERLRHFEVRHVGSSKLP